MKLDSKYCGRFLPLFFSPPLPTVYRGFGGQVKQQHSSSGGTPNKLFVSNFKKQDINYLAFIPIGYFDSFLELLLSSESFGSSCGRTTSLA